MVMVLAIFITTVICVTLKCKFCILRNIWDVCIHHNMYTTHICNIYFLYIRNKEIGSPYLSLIVKVGSYGIFSYRKVILYGKETIVIRTLLENIQFVCTPLH